jgi:hypothetical protein
LEKYIYRRLDPTYTCKNEGCMRAPILGGLCQHCHKIKTKIKAKKVMVVECCKCADEVHRNIDLCKRCYYLCPNKVMQRRAAHEAKKS